MTIQLPNDLEQIVHDAVRAGQYASENDMIRDALTRLKQAMPKAGVIPTLKTGRIQSTSQKKLPLSPDELNKQLLAAGLVTRLPNPAEDIDDEDPDGQPITIEGEPLSATILRERR